MQNNKRFLRCIDELLSSSTEAKTKELRKAILAYGSETPDNIDCAQRIENADYKDVGMDYHGLVLSNTDISLSTLLNTAEGSAVPELVTARYPGITQEDWDSVLRFCTLLLSSLDRKN